MSEKTTLDAMREQPLEDWPDYENIEDTAAEDRQQEGKPLWQKIATAQTGPGAVDDYLGHPLNFQGSLPLARIIRGSTGLLGNLDLAIIDIAMGLLELLIKARKAPPADG